MSMWRLLHLVPSALVITGPILVWSATSYFSSPPAATQAPAAGSSSGYCNPTNNGLSEECVVNFNFDLGISASFGGSATDAAQTALGQEVRGVGEFWT